jgi:hypothetical protein
LLDVVLFSATSSLPLLSWNRQAYLLLLHRGKKEKERSEEDAVIADRAVRFEQNKKTGKKRGPIHILPLYQKWKCFQ